ncbi:asparagine synthase (glutamine-hydrolyzing) [Agriterribacter sp.]|uniref:asparagine synthase (glutamine-hydrolyzing) n=1 Tax=Agriterribacter sp. TaxID=2821509 RepID=UPI002C0F5F06|nr:asparagine synthase (glutamine-hydrolyzing) [Agriterribacter sp.]HRO44565.1 asparagine synthase (glutamine-hydrolyzing) [Agriterribacter sp.]HRQ16002.1 asparagine synthase (glutamine-hydrolyzing) [Agriterribacter sp.]
MCGITGILHFNQQQAQEEVIRRITNAVSHRGPDAEGFFIENEIALGHRRLSIIDLSAAANQPFTDYSGRYVVVFNGEMYNYREVRGQINDYPFQTSSDTETLLAAYAKWGTNCLQYFKGMFAFAVWDKQQKELCLVRDRMGVKPLYYFIDEKKIIFASEIRAILASGYVQKRVDQKALYEYLSYQSVSYPLTMIEGIQQLEAGSYIKIKQGKAETVKYWNVCDAPKQTAYTNAATIQQNIKQLLGQSVQRRLVSDVPVGAFLSGGIDSSIVVGLMSEVAKVKPSTFNISFSEKEFDESEYAELIARKFNTNHTKIRLSPHSMLDDLEQALTAMDTPSGDGVNSYVVSKAIKNAGIKVALSGVGGDELFAGYPIFSQFQKLHAKSAWWKYSALIRKLGAASLFPGKFSNKKYRLQQLLRTPLPDIEHMYPVLRQMLSPQLAKHLTTLPVNDGTALQGYLFKYKEQLHQLPVLSQVSVAEYMGYTQHTLLKDTDQMSMSVALEVREPFFDTDLVEYVLGIPDRFKQPVYPKSLLVESVKPLLPDEIVFRKKQGFVFPWNIWMKNELRSFCTGYITRLCERSFINSSALQQYWKRFLSNDPSIRWMDIWLFVVLEYWLEKNGIDE